MVGGKEAALDFKNQYTLERLLDILDKVEVTTLSKYAMQYTRMLCEKTEGRWNQ